MWNDEESREVFSAMQEGGRRATQLLKAYVKEGNTDAMFVLALRKRTTAEDAVDLVKQAARKGHAFAQFYLGLMYFRGILIRKHRPSGLKWITESVDRDCICAAMWLAEHYLDADTPEKNVKNAIRILKKVANTKEYQPCIYAKGMEACESYAEFIQMMEGDAIAVAQKRLSELYASGAPGLPQDDEKAAFWLAKLYAAGLTEVAWDLVELYEKLGTSAQAESILEALVQTDDPEAMDALARLWKQSPDREKQHNAFNLLQQARKLKTAAARPSVEPPRPPAPMGVTGPIFEPIWSPKFRPSGMPQKGEYRVRSQDVSRFDSKEAKLEEVKNLLEQSPPDYINAHKLLCESDMVNYPPAAPYQQKVAIFLAYPK